MALSGHSTPLLGTDRWSNTKKRRCRNPAHNRNISKHEAVEYLCTLPFSGSVQNIHANTPKVSFRQCLSDTLSVFAETSGSLKCTFPPLFSTIQLDFSRVFSLLVNCAIGVLGCCFHSDPHSDGLACLKHFTCSRSVDCCVTLHKGLPVLTALLTLVSEPQCRVTLDLDPGQLPWGSPAMRTESNHPP